MEEAAERSWRRPQMGRESRQDSRPRMGRESRSWTGRKSRTRMGRGSRTQGRRRRRPAARFQVSRRALLSPSRLPFPPSTGASQMDASLAGGMRALLPLSRALEPLFPARTQRSALSPARATHCVFPARAIPGFPPLRVVFLLRSRARRPPRASRREDVVASPMPWFKKRPDNKASPRRRLKNYGS